MHLVFACVPRQGHDPILDLERIAHLSKDEAFLLGRRLDVDVTKIEHGWDEAIDRGSDILDSGKAQFTDVPVEEALLLNVHDALVRDHPDIEVVIDPDEEAVEPEKDKERVLGEGEEREVGEGGGFGKDDWENRHATEEKQGEKKHRDQVDDDVEPVTMNHHENLFVLMLSLEMEATKRVVVGHRLT